MSALTRVVLLGAPGVGKGTQAERLSARLGVPTISTGALLRAHIGAGTALGKTSRGYVERGGLVPDKIIDEIVAEFVRSEGSAGFILDGYPRTTSQAITLDALLQAAGQPLDCAIALETDEALVIERLRRRADDQSRPDDAAHIVAARLEVYRTTTQPLLDHYESIDRLHRIDGARSVDEVTDAILAIGRRDKEESGDGGFEP